MVSSPVRLDTHKRQAPAVQTLQRPAQILHPEILAARPTVSATAAGFFFDFIAMSADCHERASD